MNGDQRRKDILDLLKASEEAISGTELAKRFQVSRQVIVSDIALLKASNGNILATSKGYALLGSSSKYRIYKVRHLTEEIGDELHTVIQAGGHIVDVFVKHPLYGELRANLSLYTKYDVDAFCDQLRLGKIQPLKQLTDDYHFHTVGADSDQILDRVEANLKEKGYLVED